MSFDGTLAKHSHGPIGTDLSSTAMCISLVITLCCEVNNSLLSSYVLQCPCIMYCKHLILEADNCLFLS